MIYGKLFPSAFEDRLDDSLDDLLYVGLMWTGWLHLFFFYHFKIIDKRLIEKKNTKWKINVE